MPISDQLMAIAFVLLLLLGTAALLSSKGRWPLRLRMQSEQSKCIVQVAARLSLTPHHTLHVVSFRDQEIVIITYPGGTVVVPPGVPFHSVLSSAALARTEVGA